MMFQSKSKGLLDSALHHSQPNVLLASFRASNTVDNVVSIGAFFPNHVNTLTEFGLNVYHFQATQTPLCPRIAHVGIARETVASAGF
jgi:hypothetical protein